MKTESSLNQKQGHWILAKLGKKVLRPGGRLLTEWLVRNLEITSKDDVVEFAPGLGFTGSIACSYKPFSYTGVDMNKEAAVLAKKNIRYDKARVIIADAADTQLPDVFADKVYGEAMLTMQPIEHKRAIISEAYRLLKPGGYYAIHELGLQPDEVSEEVKNGLFKDLSSNIRVHARPMTAKEWKTLLEEQGFKVIKEQHSPMLLLEGSRILEDEGFFRTLKFLFNLLRYPDLRKRVQKMKQSFRKHQQNLDAIALIAQKPL